MDQSAGCLCWYGIHCDRAVTVPHLPASLELLGCAYTKLYVHPDRWRLCIPANDLDQCSSYQYYEIIQGCVAISADIFMLIIAIPLLLKVRVPLKQKLILLLIFGMGVFVIVAAILTKVYCLVPSLISYIYMNWYFREATVAILVTNIPLVWSLLRDVFPALRSWTGGSHRGTEQRYRSGRWTFSKGSDLRSRYAPSSRGVSMHGVSMNDYRRSAAFTPPQKVLTEVSESSEPSELREMPSDDGSARELRIRQDVTVTVERGSHPPGYWEANQTHAAV